MAPSQLTLMALAGEELGEPLKVMLSKAVRATPEPMVTLRLEPGDVRVISPFKDVTLPLKARIPLAELRVTEPAVREEPGAVAIVAEPVLSAEVVSWNSPVVPAELEPVRLTEPLLFT